MALACPICASKFWKHKGWQDHVKDRHPGTNCFTPDTARSSTGAKDFDPSYDLPAPPVVRALASSAIAGVLQKRSVEAGDADVVEQGAPAPKKPRSATESAPLKEVTKKEADDDQDEEVQVVQPPLW